MLGLGAIGHVIAAQLFQKSGVQLYFLKNRSGLHPTDMRFPLSEEG